MPQAPPPPGETNCVAAPGHRLNWDTAVEEADVVLIARAEAVTKYADTGDGKWVYAWYFNRFAVLEVRRGALDLRRLSFVTVDILPIDHCKKPAPWTWKGEVWAMALGVSSGAPTILGVQRRSVIPPLALIEETTARPVMEIGPGSHRQPRRQMKSGVWDLAPELTGRLCDGVRLVSATYDERPLWCDGSSVYELRLEFTKVGIYQILFTKQVRDIQELMRHALTLEVFAGRGDEKGIDIPVIQSTSAVVARGQTAGLKWHGRGGKRPAWADRYVWRLEAVRLMPLLSEQEAVAVARGYLNSRGLDWGEPSKIQPHPSMGGRIQARVFDER